MSPPDADQPAPTAPAGPTAPAPPAEPAAPAGSAAATGPAAAAGSTESPGAASDPAPEGTRRPVFGELSPERADRALRGVAAATLGLEALTVLFVPRAIAQVGPGLTTARLTVLLVLAGALLVAAFLQPRRVGVLVGSVLQVAILATGLLLPAMVVLAVLFGLVWCYLLRLRRQLDRQLAVPAAPPG